MICYRKWPPHHLAIGRLILLLAMVMALAPLQAFGSPAVCTRATTAALTTPQMPAPQLPNRIPAFPGAEGAGARATGGRGGKVLFVTNLRDYDPAKENPILGSLRAAIDAKGPRIVVFRVSGTIPLKTTLKVNEPYITIAGQSAPGGGVCVKNYGTSIETHDVVIRYLRFRPGDEMGPDCRSRGKAFSCDAVNLGRGAKNVIVDHCSTSWSTDEVLSIHGVGVTDVTVQWCIISESLNDSYHAKGEHGYGSLITCNGSVTYHHNLYAHHKSRTPRPGTYGDGSILLDFRNNVVYNSVRGGYSGEDPVRMNYVGNYIKPGPSSQWNCAFLIGGKASCIYADDNCMVGRDNASGDRWSIFAQLDDSNKRATPFPTAPVKTDTPAEAYRRILASVGAVLPARDALDARIIEDIRTGKGKIINSQKEVGGWPELKSATAPKDTDGDGMPDAWEKTHGLESGNAADGAADADSDGYTNVEEFLNGSDPSDPKSGVKR